MDSTSRQADLSRARRVYLPPFLAFSLATAFVALTAGSALAQQGTGAITGVVKDHKTNQPLPDVVVSVTSPNLQEDQIAMTDASGVYRLPGLPPGVYAIQFDKPGFFPNLSDGIRLRADITLRINAALAISEAQSQEINLTVRPNVDVGSSTTSTSLDSQTLRRLPVSAPGGKGTASRSFESVANVAPGANGDLYGVGINGASSPENHYSIDGMSVGDPGKGVLGTQLSTEFVEEVGVVTAGYMPEFGRATGGVLNVVTKSGSNEFHGSVFTYFSPGALEGGRKLVLQDAQPVAYDSSLSYIGDVGFDLGGPVIKDKLWFYTGFDIANTKYNLKRGIYRTLGRTADDSGQIEETPIYVQDFVADSRTVQGMGKLTWAINADNRLTFAAYATPTVSGGGASFDGTTVTPGKYAIDPLSGQPEYGGAGTYGSTAHQFSSSPIDAVLKWNSQFLDKRLLLDVMVGTHRQSDSNRASDGSSALDSSGLGAYYNVNWRRRADTPQGYHSITEFESFPGSDRCNEAGADCLVSDYVSGSPRDLNEAKYNRYHSSVIVSYLANLWGHHLLKAGFQTEHTSFQNRKSNRVFAESEDGTQFNDEERFGLLAAPDDFRFIDPLTKKTSALTVGGFLQDSWSVFDVVTVNLGLRYDTQYFYNTAGNVGLSLPNQWSPRLGVIYDPTQSGRAKVFVNYARYYENAPLAFSDVVLVGEPQLRGGHACDPSVFSQQLNECQAQENLRPNTQDDPRLPNKIFTTGGSAAALDPDIQASSSDEYSAGGEYELMPDARVGLTFTHRRINRWIEDMGPVAGQPGFAGNPGFGVGAVFPKVSRNYNALTLHFTKMFSQSWLAQASYTMASLRGNYAGLFAPEDGYLGPNGTADFDGPNVSNNRYGDLQGDYRHNLKVFASKDWWLGPKHGLSTGVALRARSGGATNYLGTDPFTYEMESYLVARGSGPRLPWTYGTDVQVTYRLAAIEDINLSLTVEIFNLLNFQKVTSIDENYTSSNVIATEGYQVSQLDSLTNDEGQLVDKNPSFGQPTSYQEPRVFRFGLRGEF